MFRIVFFLFLVGISSSLWSMDDSQIDMISRNLAAGIETSFPSFSGHVLSVREDEGIFVNIGERDGLTAGSRFIIYQSGSSIIREPNGQITGFDGERLALIEVEWVRDDYSFAKVVSQYSGSKIDYMDVVFYLQPEYSIFIASFDGDFGEEITNQVKTYLRRSNMFNITWNERDADYLVSGRIFQRSGAVDVRLNIKGSVGDTYKVERRFIMKDKDKPQVVAGNGYRAYPFPEKPLDFMTSGTDELLILCEGKTVRLKFTSTGYEIISKDPLIINRPKPIREPIGRIGSYDLDGDGTNELLIGLIPLSESRYYNRIGSSYQLAGPLPGFPIDFNKSGNLLVGKIEDGYNVFSSSSANLITISGDGNVNQIAIWNIRASFLDARLVDMTKDGETEIAILYTDSSLAIINPYDHDIRPIAQIEGIGLGLFSDGPGGLYASSNLDGEDKVYYLALKEDELIIVGETESVPYNIYRLGKHRGRIAALAYDDNHNYMIIVFEDFR